MGVRVHAAKLLRLGIPDTCGLSGANRKASGKGMVMSENAGSIGLRSGIDRVRIWWQVHVIGQVDQVQVTERRREDGKLSEHYLFMTTMSGAIAVLGLLLSSPAVVIGAMLLSPLMGPIMGLGFALAIGDWDWLKDSLRTLVIGAVMAVLLCAGWCLSRRSRPLHPRSRRAPGPTCSTCSSRCSRRWRELTR